MTEVRTARPPYFRFFGSFLVASAPTVCFDGSVTSTSISMGKAHRLVGYIVALLLASLFYVTWFTVANRTPGSDVTILFRIGIAVFFWAFGGIAAALVLMAIPWAFAVVWIKRIGQFGSVYWLLLGAALTVLFGCGASSLAPKPDFIEDQTFSQGFVIALQRQGICLLLMGLLFGLTYWYLSERGRAAGSVQDL